MNAPLVHPEIVRAFAHHGKVAGIVVACSFAAFALYRAWQLNRPSFQLTHGMLAIVGASLVAGYGVVYALVGETISVQNGLGWDGLHFARYAKDFYGQVIVRGVSEYHAQKLAPIFLVSQLLRLLGRPATDADVIHFFRGTTIAFLTLSALLWCAIAKRVQLTRAATVFGLFSLFANYSFLKLYYYCPVLVDPAGFFFGMVMCFAYVTARPILLIVASIAGAFTIPTYPLAMGALLLVLPRTAETPISLTSARRLFGGVAGLALAFGVAWLAFYAHAAGNRIGNNAEQIDAALVPISVVCLVVMLAGVWGSLLAHLPSLRALLASVRWLRVPLALGAIALVRVAAKTIGAHPPPGSPGIETTPAAHFFCILLESIAKPFISLLSHVVFFGPVFLAYVLHVRGTARAVWSHGVGLASVLVLFTFFTIDSESRHLAPLLPFIVLVVAQAIDHERRATTLFVSVYGAVCVFLSKAWLVCETPPAGSGSLPFSWQRIFMNLGPWMSLESYGIQAAAILVAFIALWFSERRRLT